MSSEEIQQHTAGENEGVLDGEREIRRGREEDRSPKDRERGSCFAFEEARSRIPVSCRTTHLEMLEKQVCGDAFVCVCVCVISMMDFKRDNESKVEKYISDKEYKNIAVHHSEKGMLRQRDDAYLKACQSAW